MILVTGGAYSGQTEFAARRFSLKETDIADGAECTPELAYSCRALKNFHLFVKRFGAESGAALAGEIYAHNPDIVIITNEIGSGIIPMEKTDRIWREETGRACCFIAGKSEAVIRMCCGIPAVIKGELP